MRGLWAFALATALASKAMAQPASAPPADAAEVDALYKKALDDFASGKFADAAAEFEEVSIRSLDPVKQTTAHEMAKQSRTRVGMTGAPIPPTTTTVPAVAGPTSELPPPSDTLPIKSRSRDSRYVLLVGTSLAGLGVYGPSLVVLADSNSNKTSVGLYMLGAGTSFIAPYLLTREAEVTWGMTDAWWHGYSRGALHGWFITAASSETPSDQQIAAAVALGSLGEGIALTAYASQTGVGAGFTNSLAKGSDFGTGFAIAATALVDPDGFDERRAGVSGLLGAGAGYLGGYYYGRLRSPTWGDGEVLRTTGILGAYTAVVPLILAESDSERTYLAIGMAGAAGGLVLGDHLLEGRDFTAGQGVVTELGTLAGGAAGAGIGYLLSPDDSATSAKVIAIGAIVGAGGGFALTYLGLDTKVVPGPNAQPVSLQLAPDFAPGRKGLVVAGSF